MSPQPSMLGAESLLRSLAASGVDVCFANPGTSEMHLVAAFDAVPSIRPVLVLAEGVASGAADGYARMTGRASSTLLHLGPGLSNALANLHNARRAASPIVNIVGDHPASHRLLDPPLASDIEALARPGSTWVRTVATADDMARDGAEAVRAAMGPPGGIATLVVPADCSWNETTCVATPAVTASHDMLDEARLEGAAQALSRGAQAALLIGGSAMTDAGMRAASRIAAKTGARLFCTTFTARQPRGAGHVRIERLPYFPELVRQALDGVRHLVLVGALTPISFFAYPGGTSGRLAPDECEPFALTTPGDDATAALEALAERLGAKDAGTETIAPFAPPALPTGALDAAAVSAVVGALMPEHAIVADEAVTTRFPALAATVCSAPHDWLCMTGGSLGLGMPLALGAALACPDRKVVNLEADGSAMYNPQALWSIAREGANVTTILLTNRRYRILDLELQRLQLTQAERARDMFDLSHPPIDYVALAGSMGVPASRAATAEELATQLRAAFAEPGPRVVEAVMG